MSYYGYDRMTHINNQQPNYLRNMNINRTPSPQPKQNDLRLYDQYQVIQRSNSRNNYSPIKLPEYSYRQTSPQIKYPLFTPQNNLRSISPAQLNIESQLQKIAIQNQPSHQNQPNQNQFKQDQQYLLKDLIKNINQTRADMNTKLVQMQIQKQESRSNSRNQSLESNKSSKSNSPEQNNNRIMNNINSINQKLFEMLSKKNDNESVSKLDDSSEYSAKSKQESYTQKIQDLQNFIQQSKLSKLQQNNQKFNSSPTRSRIIADISSKNQSKFNPLEQRNNVQNQNIQTPEVSQNKHLSVNEILSQKQESKKIDVISDTNNLQKNLKLQFDKQNKMFDSDLDDEQKSTISTQITNKNSHNIQLDYSIALQLVDILQQIKKKIQKQESSTDDCKQYLSLISEVSYDHINSITKQSDKLNIVRTSLILERISIVVSFYFQFQFPLKDQTNQKLKSMIKTIYQNSIFYQQILLNAGFYMQKDGQKQIIKLIKDNLIFDIQKVDKYYLMKKNNHLIIQNIQLLNTINDKKDLLLLEVVKIIEELDQNKKNQLDLSQYTKKIMMCLSNFIHDLENNRKNSDLQANQTPQNLDSDDILEKVNPPFLPPLSLEQQKNTYTLVLDLDETLVHYQDLEDGCGQFLVRPYAENFIEEMNKYYEIVIFTAALSDYADWILEKIDPDNLVKFKLYRQHCKSNGKNYIKDLADLGRDLNKCIIVDNLAENFQSQPENGIFIHTWTGEAQDRALYDLAPLLKDIVKYKITDVRDALRQFRDQMIENIRNGVQDPHLNIKLN